MEGPLTAILGASGSGGGQQPYQFRPESYGAKGNGVVCADVSVNGTTTITSPTVAAKAQAGMTIMINGANGTLAAPLVTTISTVTATGAVLAAAAGITASACAAVFGSDDTAAINSAISAASTYAITTSGLYLGEVLFSNKIYMLTSGPTQTTTPAVQNSQVQIPFPAVNGQSQKLIIKLTGAGDNGHLEYWESITPNLAGTVLVSTLKNAPSTPDPTFGAQSVIGGPSGGGAFTGGFANTKAVITGIAVYVPLFQNMIAYDLGFCGGLHMDACSAKGFAPAANLAAAAAAHPYLSDLPAAAAFQSTISRGLRGPLVSNNDDCTIPSLAVEGFEIGALVQDHATIDRLATLYVDVGVRLDSTVTNASNLTTISNWSCENFNGALQTTSGGGGYFPVDINLTTETVGGVDPTYDVSDAGNTLYGTVRSFMNGRTSKQVIVFSGAANLKIINGDIGPGHVASPPAVPASAATAVLVYRDAQVVIHTGVGVTVSAITIDGTATGLTMAASSSLMVNVPSGKTIALTYAGGTPTWDWWLMG